MIGVLIVDDDFMVARIHRAYVERVPGFTVVGEAHTGAAAIEAVHTLRPHLVLLDIYLPDISGLDVLRALRAEGQPPTDVLAVTAARDVESIRSAMQSGVVHYLVKPFTFATFRERLERYAEARRRLAAIEQAHQDDIDQAFRLVHGSTRAQPLPKGLSQATCRLVATVLKDAQRDLSAAEAAELAGLSRVSARRYLEHLASTGVAELQLRYGSAGRPEHRYRWAAPRLP